MKTTTAVVPATFAFAQGLFTRGTDAFGVSQIEKVFGAIRHEIPPMRFSEDELRRARELNQYLILQAGAAGNGMPFTMKHMHAQFDNKLGDGKLLYDIDWYQNEPFFTTDVPRLGWHLVSREVIPGSTSQDYVTQTQSIADYLVDQVYKGEDPPKAYRAALGEFETQKEELERLRSKDWKKCAELCAALKLNQLFREKPVEVLYGLIVQHEVNGERLLANMWTWTNQRSSFGGIVYVGGCDAGGVRVRGGSPARSDSGLGVRFSRSAVPDLES